MQDYYAVLGVTPTASDGEIRRAYLRLARHYHPDLNHGVQDRQIKLLNEAYEVLRDPRKRAAYDAHRAAELRVRALREARLKRAQGGIMGTTAATEMTWFEGLVGFVRELRRGLREE